MQWTFSNSSCFHYMYIMQYMSLFVTFELSDAWTITVTNLSRYKPLKKTLPNLLCNTVPFPSPKSPGPPQDCALNSGMLCLKRVRNPVSQRHSFTARKVFSWRMFSLPFIDSQAETCYQLGCSFMGETEPTWLWFPFNYSKGLHVYRFR